MENADVKNLVRKMQDYAAAIAADMNAEPAVSMGIKSVQAHLEMLAIELGLDMSKE